MIKYNKEYYIKPYYFFLVEKEDRLSLYYSVENTLTESRKRDEKIDFDKKHSSSVKNRMKRIVKDKKAKTKTDVKRYFKDVPKKELEELIDTDGTLNNSRVPILNMGLTPKKTTDVTITMATMVNNPVTRGYRKYYGESIEPELTEVDFSGTFGFEETKDMDGKETYEYLVDKMELDPEDAANRTIQFGKDPTGERKKNTPKKIRDKKGYIDRQTLSEDELRAMAEEIVLNKKSKNLDINKKGTSESTKFITKNVKALKVMAEKEGLTINDLIKMLKRES
jgi:hypothetical protein